ncbi:MAG: hypothetical protein GXO73_06025, partial [Calditrichaeota bacterium]|nr:hypothetical protein [Calditrichota bacterium]
MKRFAAALLVVLVVGLPWPVSLSAQPTGGWGRLELRFQDQDTVWVVTTSGTPYEMGYWYGRLLA